MVNLRKDHKDIKVHDEHHEFLTKQKIKMMGVNRCENGVFTDINGKKYRIVQLEFAKSNGSSEEITRNNYMGLKQILPQISGKCKFVWLKETTNSLDRNIRYYLQLAEKETNLRIQESLIERIELMRYFNKWKQISFYMFVSYESFDYVVELLNYVFAVEVLSERKAKKVLHMLENAMVSL